MNAKSLLAAASLALAAAPAAAGDWVLDMNAKTLTYKDWVFTISGTEDRLAIASVKSYPQVVTDIDFSTIQSDTGATPVSAGRLFYGASNGSAGRFVGKVVLAPTLETVAAGFMAYSTATNLVMPSGSVLTAIPNSFMNAAASCAFDYSTIPATVTNIDDSAFSSAYEGFGVLRIPAACRRIGNNAFYGGRSGGKMAGLVFEEGSDCESIGSGAFNQNNLSGSVAMPASLRSIGDGCFSYCKIANISFPDDSRLESIGSQAFYSTGLSGINLPGGLVSLGAEAFNTCRSLSGSITIPSGVRQIGNLTFFDCRKLQEVVFENGCNYIGTNVFANCTSLTNLVLPRTLKALGGGAFVGGYSSYAQWQAMKKGDIWWQSCPTIEDNSGLFAYCNASNGGRAGDIVNHLSFAKWSGYASAHPDTFVLGDGQGGAGTWTSPAAGATGSAIASIVNWENNPTVIVVR